VIGLSAVGSAIALALLSSIPVLAGAPSPVPQVGVGQHRPEHQVANLGDFRFENGAVVKDLKVTYVTHGTLSPAKDNVVLLMHHFIGDHHSLDHLNQIEQWRRWRREGVVPTPTDGWVGSTVTLPEDRLPLTPSDLDAWLWRIDLAMGLLVERARRLGDEDLDWQPPDGGWTLRRVLHHVARSEVLYATSFDDTLPEDPAARYAEADARLGECLTEARERAGDPSVVFPDPYGTLFTPAGVVAEVVALEHELLIQTT